MAVVKIGLIKKPIIVYEGYNLTRFRTPDYTHHKMMANLESRKDIFGFKQKLSNTARK